MKAAARGFKHFPNVARGCYCLTAPGGRRQDLPWAHATQSLPQVELLPSGSKSDRNSARHSHT